MQRSNTLIHNALTAWAAWHRYSYMCLTQGSLPPNPRNHCNCRPWHNCSENLPTKLSRGCAGAGYIWLGYPGRSSGQTQPDSPSQSPQVPCVRWARGATKQSAGLSQWGRALTRPSAAMFGPRMRRLKSLLTRPQSGDLRQAAAAACNVSIFLPETQSKRVLGG